MFFISMVVRAGEVSDVIFVEWAGGVCAAGFGSWTRVW